MTILGIDPGLSITGYGIVKKHERHITLLKHGAFTFSAKDPLQLRVGHFYQQVTQLITDHHIQHLALETPFLGKNAQNFLKLGYLRGVMYLIAHNKNLTVSEFTPQQVKQAVTGSGAAHKDQVARALTHLFQGLEIPKKQDISDALAVALCGAWKQPQ